MVRSFLRRQRAIALFLRIGINPRRASDDQWRHANAVLRKHDDLDLAAYALRRRLAP